MQSVKHIIRVNKKDSVFVYFILESYEGLTSYSTLPFCRSDDYRDLEFSFSWSCWPEIRELLNRLGDSIHELESCI